jgi:ABC-type bacteriocin/lantibiotic exporter with double-glycine peptidase domain
MLELLQNYLKELGDEVQHLRLQYGESANLHHFISRTSKYLNFLRDFVTTIIFRRLIDISVPVCSRNAITTTFQGK